MSGLGGWEPAWPSARIPRGGYSTWRSHGSTAPQMYCFTDAGVRAMYANVTKGSEEVTSRAVMGPEW
jgi:hypothetical protein